MVALKTKSALSYFGSDSEVAESLASILGHCKHVTIPFVGGASILPHLKARAIVANDRHCDAVNFYRVMSGVYGNDQQQRLIDRCQKTLSHPSEMEMAHITLGDVDSPIDERAWAFWAVCWIGRKGKGGTKHQGGMPSVRRTANGGTNASRIRAAADDLSEWAKQFERCEWESVCFRELLPKVADNPECGVYCDPPWVGVGRNYLHNFSDEDHSELEFLLRRFEVTTVVVRYGDCATVRDLYSHPMWRIIEAESRDQCNVVKGEVWITNQRGD
jgi:site-specific DNA-adenine methylase